MTDLRENINWAIGGIVAAVAAFFGWFYESGLLTTIVGIMIGAGIAIFVQSRTQKRAWKREYALKLVDEVYAPLYKELRSTVEGLKRMDYRGYWLSSWRDIQESHKYLMVDESFRTEMDELQKALSEQSNLTWKIRSEIVPKIFSEEAKRVFEVATDFRSTLSVKTGNGTTSLGDNIISYLLTGKHPKEAVSTRHTEYKKVELYGFQTEDGKSFHTQDIEKFNRFWETCMERIKSNPNIKNASKENERLLDNSKKLKEDLVKRIQEPWNI